MEINQKNFKIEVNLGMEKQKREVTRTKSEDFCEKGQIEAINESYTSH